MTRIIVIDVPAPVFPPIRKRATGKHRPHPIWLNSNDKNMHRMTEAKIARAWRAAAAEAASGIAALTPPVRIVAKVWKPRAGRYDPNNLAPTAKPCVDGLVDAGLLEDDDYTRVLGPDMRHGGVGQPRLVLMIEEERP